MNIALHSTTLSLAQNRLVALRDARGNTVRCLTGALWITESGGEGDIILGPGQCHTLTQPGLALLTALDPASFRIVQPASVPMRGVVAWLKETLGRRGFSTSG